MQTPDAPAPTMPEPRGRRRQRTLIALGLALAIFASGGVIGATMAFHSVSKRQDRLTRNPMQATLAAMEHQLALSPEQRTQVAAVLERYRAEFEADRKQMGDTYQAMTRDVEAILSAEQRQAYQEMLSHLRRRGMMSRGGGARGGGGDRRPPEFDGRRGGPPPLSGTPGTRNRPSLATPAPAKL